MSPAKPHLVVVGPEAQSATTTTSAAPTPASVTMASGACGRLMRLLHDAGREYAADDLPTPRVRDRIRAGLHAAIDAYLVERLADRSKGRR